MSQRVVIAIVLALVFFAVYSWYTTRNGIELFVPFSIDVNAQQYESSTEDLVKSQPVEADSERSVASSGPASPAQAPPRNMPAYIAPEERPFDPQEQSYESAQIPERLRHPERSFGPAVIADGTDHSVASGVASHASQVTSLAYQQFGPEMAMNGGAFLENGVMANDGDVQSSYSSV
jgi:hypothetical protein